MSIPERKIPTATAVSVKPPASTQAQEGKAADFAVDGDEDDDDTFDPSKNPVTGEQVDAPDDGKLFDDDDDEDDEADEKQKNACVEIHEAKCLKCSHLVPFEKKKYKDCHFSKGNEFCPAQSVKIIVRVPVEKIVRSFISAEKTNDMARMGRLYSQMAEQPDWFQKRAMEAVNKERRKQGLA